MTDLRDLTDDDLLQKIVGPYDLWPSSQSSYAIARAALKKEK